MKIQIISLNKSNLKNESGNEYIYSELGSPKTFDAYDVNIINLQDKSLWRNCHNSNAFIISINDFLTLKRLIKGAKKAKTIICFPQNYTFLYNYNYAYSRFETSKKLKDMIKEMKEIIETLIPNGALYEIFFEESTTLCKNEEIKADFSFSGLLPNHKILTRNIGAEHATTVEIEENLIFSTLDLLDSNTKMEAFLSEIGLENPLTSVPEWARKYQFYNDQEQKEIIEKASEKIKSAQEDIQKATRILSENMFYKRILFESGTPLVESVFKMLEKMLDCDLSSFEDHKREDFKIVLPEVTFIGEIKGINTNVKAENVSQLEVHCSEYSDQLDDEGRTENIKGILIINSQRSKPLKERDSVNQKQIDIAIRNKSLIVTSEVFLLLFASFMLGQITTERIIVILKEKTGILQVSDFISEK